jgi:hypothetical protein
MGAGPKRRSECGWARGHGGCLAAGPELAPAAPDRPSQPVGRAAGGGDVEGVEQTADPIDGPSDRTGLLGMPVGITGRSAVDAARRRGRQSWADSSPAAPTRAHSAHGPIAYTTPPMRGPAPVPIWGGSVRHFRAVRRGGSAASCPSTCDRCGRGSRTSARDPRRWSSRLAHLPAGPTEYCSSWYGITEVPSSR